jgi:hypothetical protein
MNSTPVTITVELEDDVAEQLAQFCKRSTFDTFYQFTEAHLPHEGRRERAYMMINGIERVQAALAKAGYAPR